MLQGIFNMATTWTVLFIFFLGFAGPQTFAQAQPVLARGFPLRLEANNRLSPFEGPTLADLDQNGYLDIIVHSSTKIYAFRKDGSLLPGWPQSTTYNVTTSSAIGDLDGDGHFEVVNFDRFGFSRKSFLYVWNHEGKLLPGFPMETGFGDCAVTLYDLDHDGSLEILGGFEKRYYAFNHDGTILSGWPKELAPFHPITKSAVGDINADGKPEIVVATEFISPTNPEKENLGRIYVWDSMGRSLPGWPVDTPAGFSYYYLSNPALVDVDHDGFMEIAAGASAIFGRDQYGYVALYRHDGTMMPGWPKFTAGADTLAGFNCGPAAADLDEDGDPELIFADAFDHIIAWKGNGSLVPGWPVTHGQIDSTLIVRTTFANPAIGDIDGDRRLEIFITNNQDNLVNNVWLGRIFVLNDDGTNLPWSPLRPRQTAAFNTVALGDLDRDGTLEIVALTSGNDVRGSKETWLTVWEIPGVPYVKERFPWPMYGHDRWHTSQYGFEPPDEPSVRVADRNQSGALPTEFALEQNYPNPFVLCARAAGAFTEIRFALPRAAQVQIRLFDILGAEVKTWTMMKPAGVHQVRWNGRDNRGQPLPSGVYFYRLEAASSVSSASLTKKLLLMRQR